MPFYNTISCQFLSEIKVRVTRNVSFLNIFTNSWNAHPIAKIKLFGSRGESALGGGHKYRPIKSYPLAGWPLAAYEQPKCVRSFLLFSLSFFPRVSLRKMSPRAVYSESDSESTRMTSLPFPKGLERFASFSPPRGDPLSSSSSLIRTFLFEGRIGRKSRVGYREFSAILGPLHLARIRDTFVMSAFRKLLLFGDYCLGLLLFFSFASFPEMNFFYCITNLKLNQFFVNVLIILFRKFWYKVVEIEIEWFVNIVYVRFYCIILYNAYELFIFKKISLLSTLHQFLTTLESKFRSLFA